MNLLVVGAGAIGSVYGYLASLPSPSGEGAKITYLIKPKHRKNLAGGITLYPWKGKKAEAVLFENFSMVESFAELKTLQAEKPFDAVLITLPSDKILADGWMNELFESIGNAKIWSLQPNLRDHEFIKNSAKKVFGENFLDRLVWGTIPILSYLAPLPGENFERPGYAFYTPPFAKALWSSVNNSSAQEVADFYLAHGLPSKAVKDFSNDGILGGALLGGVVAGLEKSEWSFDKLLNGTNLPLVTEGIREMTAIQAKNLGIPDPGATWLGKLASSAFGIRKTLRLANFFIPFDFEAFLRVHFTKVETQMQVGMLEMIEDGKKLRLSTTNLVLLKGRVRTKVDPTPSSPHVEIR